jgi:predicted N-formylglutamate amidohydrolase
MKPTRLLMTCEHAVSTVPAIHGHLFQEQPQLLQTHRGLDIGANDIALQLSKTFGCDYVSASITRLLIDCNRSLKHPACFSEFTKSLPQAEKQQLIEQYYLPYRQHVESLIQQHIAKGHQVFHLSIHSFTPIYNGKPRNASIGLLYDPKRHGEKEVAREWYGILTEQTNYRIRFNYPYLGSSDGFTTYLRTQYSEKDYLGIEVEVNQALVEDKLSLSEVGSALSASLNELLQLL